MESSKLKRLLFIYIFLCCCGASYITANKIDMRVELKSTEAIDTFIVYESRITKVLHVYSMKKKDIDINSIRGYSMLNVRVLEMNTKSMDTYITIELYKDDSMIVTIVRDRSIGDESKESSITDSLFLVSDSCDFGDDTVYRGNI